jgi:hypothetical protein
VTNLEIRAINKAALVSDPCPVRLFGDAEKAEEKEDEKGKEKKATNKNESEKSRSDRKAGAKKAVSSKTAAKRAEVAVTLHTLPCSRYKQLKSQLKFARDSKEDFIDSDFITVSLQFTFLYAISR